MYISSEVRTTTLETTCGASIRAARCSNNAASIAAGRSSTSDSDRAMSALDTSKQPYIMPVVGYTGHIRGLADADKNYGTTHWKNSGMVNPNNKAAASLPWDNRDVAGRPYGGWTPGDGGKYEEDPDIEEKKKAAAEANEILELRSMGIRALIQKSPELGGSRGGPPRPEL